ncbi:MAG: ABC transporter permease [Thermomicrobiales bacterium]|jgi:peptide/nickel transport system permease protein|nr:ABC transporter permease [Thermomicrobiales bacterium]
MSARYLLARLAQAIFLLWGISTIVFVVLRLSGDPVLLLVPQETPPEVVDSIREEMGFNAPLIEQYGRFLGRLVQLDFGQSLSYNQPALDVVFDRFPSTLKLAVAAIAFTILTGVPLGILAALHRNSIIDRFALIVALLGTSAPTFWVGILLILLFSVRWQLLPSIGDQGPSSLILPAVTLGIFSTAKISRLTRSAFLEVLRSDFLRTARAKGLRERVVLLRHAAPNTLITLVTVIGLEFALLLGGAVITETVFSWPGIGRLAIQAIGARDYPLVQAIVFVFASLVILVNFLLDLLYPLIDPRIKAR